METDDLFNLIALGCAGTAMILFIISFTTIQAIPDVNILLLFLVIVTSIMMNFWS